MSKHFYNKEIIDMAIDLYNKGYSYTKIGEELSVDRHQIGKHLKDLGFVRKSNVNSAKFKYDYNSNIFLEIVDKYKNGESIHKLADCYSMSTNVIRKALDLHNVKVNKPSSKKKTVNFNRGIFKAIDTEEKAYWFGFILADGGVSSSPRYTIEIGLAEKDYGHLVKFCDFINLDYSCIKAKFSKINGKRFKSYRVCLSSKEMYNDLFSKGVTPRKSLTLKCPDDTIISNELKQHMFRGYFDGDGCISSWLHANGKTTMCKCSLLGTMDFLNNFELFMSDKDSSINFKVPYFVDRSNCYEVTHGGRLQVDKIYNILYKNATIFLDRKMKKFVAVLGSNT